MTTDPTPPVEDDPAPPLALTVVIAHLDEIGRAHV